MSRAKLRKWLMMNEEKEMIEKHKSNYPNKSKE
jgi:hypothetical protein